MLSQALVAFSVEFDNEAEHRLVHRTTTGPAADAGRGPWLVSQAMWENVMRYVEPEGLSVGSLQARARTTMLLLAGLQRWGYLSITRNGAKWPGAKAGADDMVRPTRAGRAAQAVWRPLDGIIEERWRNRFGAAAVDSLRRSLEPLAAATDGLPRYLPVIVPTQGGRAERPLRSADHPPPGPTVDGVTPKDLSVLLSRALLAFTLEFEDRSPVSLAVGADTLGLLDQRKPVPMRELPVRSGVSIEAQRMSVGFLVRRGWAVVEPGGGNRRGPAVRLTATGQRAQQEFHRELGATEGQWVSRFGADLITAVRDSLGALVGDGSLAGSPLAEGLRPYPDGWRAAVRPPATLPLYPMVLHRGGYPDGS
jgi:DNA-binding MarR family transcriptional regulator